MNLIIIFTVFVTLCCNENVLSNTNFYELNTVKPIELTAVGRVADLGDLYDARSDQFLTLNLFKSELPNASIGLTQNSETKLKYTQLNSYEEKFQALDISAELKLSILGDLIELDGSGRYFKNTKTSARTEQASLINSYSTSFQKISITESSIRSLVDLDILEQIDATHIVVGIQWGGNVMITVEDSSYESKDSQNTQGRLGIKMKKIAGLFGASGNGQVNLSQSEINEMNKFSFEIIGDILPDNTPQTFIDAIKFMQSAPILLQKSNNGKGKAMKYKLIPISILRKLWKMNSAVNSVLKSVDVDIVKRCVKLFDDMNKVEQKINDLVADVDKMEDYFDKDTINEVKNLQNNYGIYQSEVQKNLSEHLIKVRSGNETVSQLEDVIKQALKHPYSYETINLTRFDSITEEISFIELLKKMNVTVLNKKTIFKNFLLENFNNHIYILFYNLTRNEDFSTSEFWNILENKQKFGAIALFAAISNKILNENHPSPSKEKISLFLRGKVEIENFEMSHIPENATNPELWSFYHMQNQVSTLINDFNASKQNQVSTLINDFNALKQNPVPIGFIYVQLPNEKSPTEIWSWMTWNDVSSAYAGVFFRVVGGEAASFGQIQQDNAPRLIRVNRHEHTIPDEDIDVEVPKGGCSKWSYTGNWVNDYSNGQWHRYCSSDGEVRPRNMAIRIWKRTG